MCNEKCLCYKWGTGCKECCCKEKMVGTPYYFILTGFYPASFKMDNPSLEFKVLHKISGFSTENFRDDLLRNAEYYNNQGYKAIKIWTFDQQGRNVHYQDVCFEEETVTKIKAKLC